MPISNSTHKKFPIPGITIHDKRMADMQAVKDALVSIDASLVSSITANFPGSFSANVGTLRYYPNKDISIVTFNAWISEVSATDININVLKNGSVVKSLVITAGQLKISNATLPNVSVSTADYITIDIVSGTGKDLVIRMDY